MADKYAPTIHDIEWIATLVSKLKVNGLWSYNNRPILFKKTAEKTMTLISAPTGDADVDDQIERNRVVMERAGIEFVDGRR